MAAQDDAFLFDIITNPNEDGLRLIYADWLDENDDPRGEFIRLQMELNELDVTSSKRKKIKTRLRRLFRDHGKQWSAPLKDVDAALQFRRGFPDHAQIDVQTFLNHGEEIFAMAPITELTLLDGDTDQLQKVPKSPLLEQIRTLILDDCSARIKVARAIARSVHLERLEFLNLSENQVAIGPAGMEALADSEHLPRLTGLNLTHNRIGSEGFQRLADSKTLKLEHLDTCGNQLTPEDMDRFGSSEAFENLHTLCLWYNQLGDAGIERFLTHARLPKLERLNLNNNEMTLRGAKALAESPLLAQLKELHLAFTDQLGAQAHEIIADRVEVEKNLWVNFYSHQEVDPKVRDSIEKRLKQRVSYKFDTRWREDEDGWFWCKGTKQKPR